jgi:hypothetical protein
MRLGGRKSFVPSPGLGYCGCCRNQFPGNLPGCQSRSRSNRHLMACLSLIQLSLSKLILFDN